MFCQSYTCSANTVHKVILALLFFGLLHQSSFCSKTFLKKESFPSLKGNKKKAEYSSCNVLNPKETYP